MININARCRIIQGEDRNIPVVLLLDNSTWTPLNLTGATEIVATFIKRDGTAIDKTLSGSGGVTIVDATCGSILIALSAVNTNDMKASDKQSFEIAVTLASGKIRKTQVLQRLDVVAKLEC